MASSFKIAYLLDIASLQAGIHIAWNGSMRLGLITSVYNVITATCTTSILANAAGLGEKHALGFPDQHGTFNARNELGRRLSPTSVSSASHVIPPRGLCQDQTSTGCSKRLLRRGGIDYHFAPKNVIEFIHKLIHAAEPGEWIAAFEVRSRFTISPSQEHDY